MSCKKLLLAPGEYLLSIAIWDKNETLAFDYHNTYYNLTVLGRNICNELLNIPFEFSPSKYIYRFFYNRNICLPDLSILNAKWGKRLEASGIKVESVKLLNSCGEEKDVFVTNESVQIIVNLNSSITLRQKLYLWVGFYRDDNIYCQGITGLLGRYKNFRIVFPKFALLPGGYKYSFGIWDKKNREFLILHHGIYNFRMIFSQEDHGTVYLEHRWKWELPKIK